MPWNLLPKDGQTSSCEKGRGTLPVYNKTKKKNKD
jgi:hypothetical protein